MWTAEGDRSILRRWRVVRWGILHLVRRVSATASRPAASPGYHSARGGWSIAAKTSVDLQYSFTEHSLAVEDCRRVVLEVTTLWEGRKLLGRKTFEEIRIQTSSRRWWPVPVLALANVSSSRMARTGDKGGALWGKGPNAKKRSLLARYH